MAIAIVGIIDIIQTLVFWLILARIVVSWIRVDPYHPIVRAIFDLTEPLLGPIRRRMPSTGMFDLSPIVLLFAVQIGGEILKTVVLSVG